MTTIAKFEAIEEWKELTGVSSQSGIFTVQNRGQHQCLLYAGGASSPVEDLNALTLDPGLDRVIDNTENTEEIWIKAIGPGLQKKSLISINQG